MGLSRSLLPRWPVHTFQTFLRLPRHKQLYILSGILLGYSVLLLSLQFFIPKNATFSYAEPTCIGATVLFPSLYAANGDDLQVQTEREITVGNYPLIARSLCVTPKTAPQPGDRLTSSVALRPLPLIQQRLHVDIPNYPTPLHKENQAVIELSVRDDVVLAFDVADSFFDYQIQANGKQQACEKQEILLRCSLASLELDQASTYEITIERMFNGLPVESITKKTLHTLDPLEVTESSVDLDAMVYERPESIRLTFNKPLQTPEHNTVAITDESGIPVEHEIEHSDTDELTIHFKQELARETTYSLVVTTGLTAEDNTVLKERWELRFNTSGGPSVAGSTLTGSGLSQDAATIVTFDQDLQQEQNIEELVTLLINGSSAEFSASVRGSEIVVLAGELPLCSRLELRIEGEIFSEHDVAADVSFSTNGRVTCRTTSIIGNSVSGAPIYAYTFGDGPNTILYVGGMHGNEYSSVVLLNEWLEELDANPDRIPSDKKVIVVPSGCPDCVASRSRFNGNQVDLNRNFPTDDWQSEVFVPGSVNMPEGGGSQALSEPEAKALANLVRRERPMLTLTYHAVADVVISNDAGRSVEWGKEYARLAGYNFSTTSNIENIFSYTATGAFEDWIKDELNLPALLVELATMQSDEMGRNRSALWYTLSL